MSKKQQFISLFLCAIFGIVWASSVSAALSPRGHVPYRTFIYGVNNPELKQTLRRASKLVAGQARPPRTINELKQRAVEDMKTLQVELSAQGYYDAEMDFFVEIETMPVTVYLKVKLGPLYRLGAFKIKSDPPDDPQIPLIAENVGRIGIRVGMPAQKDKIKAAVDHVVKFFKDRGKPLAKIKDNRMVVDRASKEMHVALLVDSGPLVRFGNIIIEGSGGVSADFIKSKIVWKKGDIYNREKIMQTIQRLHNSRLFKNIKITNADEVNGEGFMDVFVRLIGVVPSEYTIGSEYEPKKGLISTAKWEGRNLLERGEVISLGSNMGKNQKTGEVSMLLPDFQTVNLDLVTKVRAGKWDSPAYTKQGIETKTFVQYPIFGPELLGQAAFSFEINNIEKGGDKENTYRILGFPFGLKYSSVVGGNQPRKGAKVTAKLYPYMTVFGKMKAHVRAHLKPKIFYPLTKEEDVVLLGWMDIGFTPGAGKSVIPAHKLFYPGGSKSIRGYKFQMAGPLDSNNNPKGGRSTILMGVGANSYLTDDITLSGYMDWGTTYDRQYGDFSTRMLWGIGAGLRYNTSYGNLSFDIGSPVKRRQNVDDAIEFYISFNVKPYEMYQGLSRAFTPAAL